jgi:hypothetical protein
VRIIVRRGGEEAMAIKLASGRRLSDHSQLAINVASSNLTYTQRDLTLPGAGRDLAVNTRLHRVPSARGLLLLRTTSWVLLVGLVGLTAVLLHRQGCLHTGPPVEHPSPGTPRADFCQSLSPGRSWWILLVIPCLLVAVTSLLTRGRFFPIALVAAGLVLAQVADVVVVHTLEYTYTL